MRECTCQPTFAEPGLANDDQVLVPGDPIAGDQLGEQRFVETARRFHIDILDDGILPEACKLQAADEPLVLALDGLAIDQQAEPFLEREGGDIGVPPLLFERFRHSSEAERDEPLFGWMCEHCSSFSLIARLRECACRSVRADQRPRIS
jgi:hypothetical protein